MIKSQLNVNLFIKEVKQSILSFNSYYILKWNVQKCQKLLLSIKKIDFKFNELISLISNENSIIMRISQNKDDICKFLCYFGLYCDYDNGNILDDNIQQIKLIDFLFTKLNDPFNESEIIAILKIMNYLVKVSFKNKKRIKFIEIICSIHTVIFLREFC